MARQAVHDEGLNKSVWLGVSVTKDSADVDICGELMALHDDLGIRPRLAVSGCDMAVAKIQISSIGCTNDVVHWGSKSTLQCL